MSEKYYNLYEHIPEDEHSHISNKIWEAFERAGIKLSQDAELSIRVYDDEEDDDYDPTPQYLYDDTNGEPQVSWEEREGIV